MTGHDGVFRTFLVLRARPGAGEAFAARFIASGVIEASLPYGILRGELIDLPEPDAFLVAAVWPSPEHYDGWRGAPERADLLVGLREVMDPDGSEGTTAWDAAASPSVAASPLDVSPVLDGDPRRRHVVVA